MAKWSKQSLDIRLVAHYIPSNYEEWGHTGSCIVHAENPQDFSKKLPKNVRYNLTTEVYMPDVDLPLSEGELEHLAVDLEGNLDRYAFELRQQEVMGQNFRRLYSLTGVIFTIGVLATQTWWWLFFVTPYWGVAGIGNKYKYKKAKYLQNYDHRQVIEGKDPARKDAVNEMYEFYNKLEGHHLNKLQRARDFCKEQKKKNPAFKEIEEGYRDLIDANLEDSFLLQMYPYTSLQSFLRFFTGGPYGIVQPILTPKQIVPVRNFNLNAKKYLKEKK